jgi:hypothetical protein
LPDEALQKYAQMHIFLGLNAVFMYSVGVMASASHRLPSPAIVRKVGILKEAKYQGDIS